MLTHFLCFHTECPYFCVGSGLLFYVLLFNAFLFCYRPRDAKSNKPYQFLYCVCVYGLYHRCLCGGMVLSCILEEVCGHTVISKVFPYLQETAVVKNPKVYNIKEKGVIFHPVGTYFYSFVSSVCVNGCLLYFQVISTSILYSLVLNERHRTCNGLRFKV